MTSVPSPNHNWLPHSDQSPCYAACVPPPPPPGFPPLPPGFYQSRPPRGPPCYPCSICSLEVGKDSLKCSTCYKWVHFSCSSLTRADFRKICAAGSPMGWNCPACLNGDLASPTLRPASPRPFSPAPPPPTPPPLACSDLMDSSLPLPSHPPLLNTYPPSAFTLPASSPPPTGSQPVHNLPPHPQGNPRLTKSPNSSMKCRRSFLLPPCQTDRFSLWQPL